MSDINQPEAEVANLLETSEKRNEVERAIDIEAANPDTDLVIKQVRSQVEKTTPTSNDTTVNFEIVIPES